jgi:hypothetical protein
MKLDTVSCHFYFNESAGNSLEYTVVQILCTNITDITNKPYLGKKPLKATQKGSLNVTWDQRCKQ